MTINNKGVMPAIGLGLVAGAAIGMMAQPKKGLKRRAEKTAKAVGEAVGQAVNGAVSDVTQAFQH